MRGNLREGLLGSTTLLGVAALGCGALGCGVLGNAGTAQASDGIKLEVGGWFSTAYQVVIDDNKKGEGGHDRNVDGVFSDAEIYFTGEVELDNGLTAGARVELEGETADDQIDEAYVYFSGTLGELRIGSDDEAIATMCITPPGWSNNFGATSPDEWAANTTSPLSSNSVCSGVDESGDAQKFVYFSPVFNGFQLGVSYTPNGGHQTQADGVGPHVGMPVHGFDGDGDGNVDTTESTHNFSVYLGYTYEGDGWSLAWGGGGAWQGKTEGVEGNADSHRNFYQTGLNLTYGGFSAGAAFQYYQRIYNVNGVNAWSAAVGTSYNMDAWTFGLQYAFSTIDIAELDPDTTATFHDSGDDFTMNRVVATVGYDLGPGINVDGEIGYTWTDADGNADFEAGNNYDAVEIGIGTTFTF